METGGEVNDRDGADAAGAEPPGGVPEGAANDGSDATSAGGRSAPSALPAGEPNPAEPVEESSDKGNAPGSGADDDAVDSPAELSPADEGASVATAPAAVNGGAGGAGGSLDDGLGAEAVPDDPDSELHTDQVVEWSPERRFARFNTVMGEGAFKVVYKGEDREFGREIAWNAINMKAYKNVDKQRILDEVMMLRKLSHPRLLSFYGSWFKQDEYQVVFVTELFHGGTLKQFVDKYPISMTSFKKILRQILDCLAYLHANSVIHRDLKCDNIFIDAADGSITIGDLGLSKQISIAGMAAESVLGTPEFMAPEMYNAKYKEDVDIYALGMCALEMLTKKAPYSECRGVAQVMKKVTAGHPPDALADLGSDERLGGAYDFINKCVRAKDRPSAKALLEDEFLIITEEDDDIVTYPPEVEGGAHGEGGDGAHGGGGGVESADDGGVGLVGVDSSRREGSSPRGHDDAGEEHGGPSLDDEGGPELHEDSRHRDDSADEHASERRGSNDAEDAEYDELEGAGDSGVDAFGDHTKAASADHVSHDDREGSSERVDVDGRRMSGDSDRAPVGDSEDASNSEDDGQRSEDGDGSVVASDFEDGPSRSRAVRFRRDSEDDEEQRSARLRLSMTSDQGITNVHSEDDTDRDRRHDSPVPATERRDSVGGDIDDDLTEDSDGNWPRDDRDDDREDDREDDLERGDGVRADDLGVDSMRPSEFKPTKSYFSDLIYYSKSSFETVNTIKRDVEDLPAVMPKLEALENRIVGLENQNQQIIEMLHMLLSRGTGTSQRAAVEAAVGGAGAAGDSSSGAPADVPEGGEVAVGGSAVGGDSAAAQSRATSPQSWGDAAAPATATGADTGAEPTHAGTGSRAQPTDPFARLLGSKSQAQAPSAGSETHSENGEATGAGQEKAPSEAGSASAAGSTAGSHAPPRAPAATSRPAGQASGPAAAFDPFATLVPGGGSR